MSIPKALLIGATVVVCLALAFMGFAIYCMSAHPVSMSRLDQVVEGMESDQVERLLGSPTKVDTSEDGSQSWLFTSCVWCMVTVELSPEGEVVEVIHDH